MDKYTIIVEKDEDGVLIGSAVELPGCHTQAKTYDELYSRMKEAIELYLEPVEDDWRTGGAPLSWHPSACT